MFSGFGISKTNTLVQRSADDPRIPAAVRAAYTPVTKFQSQGTRIKKHLKFRRRPRPCAFPQVVPELCCRASSCDKFVARHGG